jgi:type II secretory pathway predicted ATPase ExeA
MIFLPHNVNRTIGAGLTGFAHRYDLGARKLSAMVGGTQAGFGFAAAARLLRGVQGIKLQPKSKPLIEAGVTKFLKDRKAPDSLIRAELKAIFEGDLEPMITPRRVLPFSVQQYFGLKRDPFALSSDPQDPSEAFSSKDLDRLTSHIEHSIRYQGFTAIVGDVGAGKSFLKARVIDVVDKSKGRLNLIWPKFAEMGRVTSGSIINVILEEFSQQPRKRLVDAQKQLERLLENYSDQGKSVALGFDEAHHLSDDTLSALKNFYELGTRGYERHLGVVLFAQPRFLTRMEDYRFREIAERLEIVEMPPLTKVAWDYVAHRVSLAGGDADRIFERDAVKRLAARNPRPLGLGNLCNATLIEAFNAQERKVLASFVKSLEPTVRAGRSV